MKKGLLADTSWFMSKHKQSFLKSIRDLEEELTRLVLHKCELEEDICIVKELLEKERWLAQHPGKTGYDYMTKYRIKSDEVSE